MDNCKGKGNDYIKGHIKEIQDIYKQENIEMKKPKTPHEPYFNVLILQGQLIIGPTKKMVTSYVVEDLALLD